MKKVASSRLTPVSLVLSVLLFLTDFSARGANPVPADEELVDIKKFDPTIVVELRYAGSRNLAGRPLYPLEMPALVRASVARRLIRAQAYLQPHGFGLKIWDAYRPPLAQMQLWQLLPNSSYVANPADGRGSLHTWGVAVDATLVDHRGQELAMPTDFDDFSAKARLRYEGEDAQVNFHLKVLQTAMHRGGFYGLRTEWWHFIAYDWKRYGPIQEVELSAR